MSPALRKETVVGMIADPGLPMALARRLKVALENFLGQELDNDTNWVVETEDFSLPVDRQGRSSSQFTRVNSRIPTAGTTWSI